MAASHVNPPRCLRCAYVLRDLPSPGVCPECGQYFDLRDPSSFTTRPPFLRWVFWMPGLLLSMGGGFLVMVVVAVAMGNWGSALWVATPLSAGCLLGYRCRVGPALGAVFAIGLTLSLIASAMMLNLAGVFCGLILLGVLLVPIGIGLIFGAILRMHLKGSTFSQRSYLPVLAFLVLPVIWAAIEGRSPLQPDEQVQTSMVIRAPVGRAWEAIMFYEEVEHRAPWILRIGLARPLSTRGPSRQVGDVKVCIYNKGQITKRIVVVEPGRRLGFEIIEQQIGYERDVQLLGGSFEFEALGPGQTRVTLVSSYRPLLLPRFCWRWGERIAFRTLHGHVLEGMRLRAEEVQVASGGGVAAALAEGGR
jgi:hypothetical protein